MLKRAPEKLRKAAAMALVLLLCAMPASAGIRFQVTQGLTLTGADGIYFENPNGLTLTGADGFLAFDANGIRRVGADGLTLTGADGRSIADADGVSYTGANTYTAAHADGLTLTGADGLTLTGADGLTLTGADGTTYQVNSVVIRQPSGLTLTGADGLTLTGADGLTLTGADGLTLTGADGITALSVGTVQVDGAAQVVATGSDGLVFYVEPVGLTLTGADALALTGANNVVAQGVQMLSLAGVDGLPAATYPTQAYGLFSFDPELALKLDKLTDDSNVNAVIVYHNAVTDFDIAQLLTLGVTGGTRYRALPMVSLTTTKKQLDLIADLPGVRTIYGNRTLQWNDFSRHSTGLMNSLRDTELSQSNGGTPLDGKGVTVAILDTGLDATHPDIAGRVAKNVKLIDPQGAQLVGFHPPANTETLSSTDQVSGHGTFVAGIVAGNGSTSEQNKFRGYAPKAHLVGLSAGDASLLNVIAGFDYLLSHPELNVRVVNCSFSANTVYDENDPVNVATRMLTERGTNVVFSAGNSGSGLNTLNPYAAAPWVISVGAVGDYNRLAGFSSRGRFGSRNYRPTLVAPGVNVISLRAAGTNLTGTTGLPSDLSALTPAELQHYTSASGTSFSAPAVAGTIALMLDANPALTPAEVRDILQRTATPLPKYYQHEVGAGALNTHAALLEATFPERRIGYFRAAIDRGQVRFVKEPSKTVDKTLQPGVVAQSSFAVPRNAIYASFQIAWGPIVSPNDLALAVIDHTGAVVAESNYLNLPGLTGKRERVLVQSPAMGNWGMKVMHTAGSVSTAQAFKGVFETAFVDYEPISDISKLDAATVSNIRQAIRTFTMWPDAGRFRPGAHVKRYELAEAMVAAGRVAQYVPGTPTFKDVSDPLTMNFVESAHHLFPDATPGGSFRPDARTTRLTAVVVLVRAAGLQHEADANMTTPLDILDASSIPAQYRGYVYVALNRGLMSPLSCRFRHNRDLTRAELAQALAALMRL